MWSNHRCTLSGEGSSLLPTVLGQPCPQRGGALRNQARSDLRGFGLHNLPTRKNMEQENKDTIDTSKVSFLGGHPTVSDCAERGPGGRDTSPVLSETQRRVLRAVRFLMREGHKHPRKNFDILCSNTAVTSDAIPAMYELKELFEVLGIWEEQA